MDTKESEMTPQGLQLTLPKLVTVFPRLLEEPKRNIGTITTFGFRHDSLGNLIMGTLKAKVKRGKPCEHNIFA